MRCAIALVVAACGSQPPAPSVIGHQAPPAPRIKQLLEQPLVHRTVRVGGSNSARGIWELKLDGETATLVHTDQSAPGPLTLDDADETPWMVDDTKLWRGPVRREHDFVMKLELASDDDSLYMYCRVQTIEVAVAGSARVHRPDHEGDCDDPGMWSPGKTVHAEALVCHQGRDAPQIDDEGTWLFGVSPGIERAEIVAGCFTSAGLRLAR
jgi:hypothetical protein